MGFRRESTASGGRPPQFQTGYVWGMVPSNGPEQPSTAPSTEHDRCSRSRVVGRLGLRATDFDEQVVPRPCYNGNAQAGTGRSVVVTGQPSLTVSTSPLSQA
jgi:hypothetical protein